jgi:hypothetical protein
VPAGLAGPFRLVLVAVADGAYTVGVAGRARERVVYWDERRGRVRAGDRLGAEIDQRFGEFERPEPRTARVIDGWLGALSARKAGLPPTVVVGPPDPPSSASRR